MAYTKQGPFVNGQAPALNADRLNAIDQGVFDAHDLIESLPSGGSGTGPTWDVPLSSFAGSTDDAKLGNFMSWAAAQTFKGATCVLDEQKTYSFSTKRTLYSGFSIRGGNRPMDQSRSGEPSTNKISLSGVSGGWFTLPSGNTFACSFDKLVLSGGSSNRLIDGHASNVLWTSMFRDITAVNMGGVLGSTSQKLLMTACSGDGFWNVNNIQDTAWCIGGSDNRFAFSQFLVDSPGDAGQFPSATNLMRFESLSKTHFSNFYCTAEGAHSGFLVSSSGDLVTLTGCAIEGRNANSPCNGSVVRLTGNTNLTLRDTWLAYAMSAPTSGHNGVVTATAGSVLMDGCVYERANGVAETVPLLYASAGTHYVKNIRTKGTWSGKPRVTQTGTATIIADDSVTVVTA